MYQHLTRGELQNQFEIFISSCKTGSETSFQNQDLCNYRVNTNTLDKFGHLVNGRSGRAVMYSAALYGEPDLLTAFGYMARSALIGNISYPYII